MALIEETPKSTTVLSRRRKNFNCLDFLSPSQISNGCECAAYSWLSNIPWKSIFSYKTMKKIYIL